MFEWGNVTLFSVASTGHVGVFSEHVCALFRVFTSALENWKKWELSSAWPCWGWTDWPVSITITTCWIWRPTSSGHTRKWSGQWNKTWNKHQLYAHFCIKKKNQVSLSSRDLFLYGYNTLMRLWQTSETLCNPLHPQTHFLWVLILDSVTVAPDLLWSANHKWRPTFVQSCCGASLKFSVWDKYSKKIWSERG